MQITVTDEATPALRGYLARLRGAAAREELHRTMAFGVERVVRRHLRTNYATKRNALGGTSTGFWKKAIESTVVSADGVAGTMTIQERGVALRYFGGTVVPTRRNYLTIPAAAEAHGKRAKEVSGGYAKQEWLFNRAGKPFAIAEKVKVDKQGRQTGGRVLFWLTKSTTHRPDKNVLPTEGAMVRAAAKAAEGYVAGLAGMGARGGRG